MQIFPSHLFASLFKKTDKTTQQTKKNDTLHTYTTKGIALHFNVSQKSVEEILLKLGWIDETYTPTQEGIKQGAIQNEEEILLWDAQILRNEIFITEINNKINTLVVALSNHLSKQNHPTHKYAYIA